MKKADPHHRSQPSINFNYSTQVIEYIHKAQQEAVLFWLKMHPMTTIHIREKLGIAHPAGRIMELRNQGYFITTKMVIDKDHVGRNQKVALYKLDEDYSDD